MADIDFDGKNELMLGTYGHQLLVYKETMATTPQGKKYMDYTLAFKHTFAKPVMSMHLGDLCQDGVDNVVVVTSTGVHILQVFIPRSLTPQPNLDVVTSKVLQVMSTIREIRDLEDKLEQETKKKEQLEAQCRQNVKKTPLLDDKQ